MDMDEKRCVAFEEYLFVVNEITSFDILKEQVRHIYDNHQWLMAGFWKGVTACVKNTSFTLVPKSVFNKDKAAEYLHFVSNTHTEKERPIYSNLDKEEAVVVGSLPVAWQEWFGELHPTFRVSFEHQTSAFINGVMQYKRFSQADRPQVCLLIEDKYMVLAVVHQNKLIFCNTFPYKSTRDIVYFALLSFNQLKLDAKTTETTLWGRATTESKVYTDLTRHLRNLTFGRRPDHVYFNYLFDEVEEWRYFDLFSMSFA